MIKEILDAYAKSIEKVWAHDRTKTIGASEIGQCARRTHWIKNGKKPEEDVSMNYGAMLRGTMMENYFWVPAMAKKYKKKILYSGETQKTFQDKYLSATPDGLFIDQPLDALKDLGIKDLRSDCFLADCKSIDPRVDLSKEKEEHGYQVQVQLGLVRQKTKYKPEYAVISYIDASFWHDVDEYVVRFDPKIFAAAHARAEDILNAKSGKDLKPEGWIAGGKECEYCPYTKACGVIRHSVPEREAAVDPQFAAEMTDLAREYIRCRDAGKTMEVAVREAQEAIKERLRDKGIRKVPGVVTWSPQKGRASYDMVAIREAATAKGIDIEKFSTAGEPTDRLTINVK